MAETIATNRQVLLSIVKIIILCGRHNIALRGHRDSMLDIERDAYVGHVASHGNFWALFNFRVDAGDAVLAKHLESARRNATYTSSDIQNQLIGVLGDHIRGKILTKVAKAQWYTIIVDELADVSNKEQLSLVLR